MAAHFVSLQAIQQLIGEIRIGEERGTGEVDSPSPLRPETNRTVPAPRPRPMINAAINLAIQCLRTEPEFSDQSIERVHGILDCKCVRPLAACRTATFPVAVATPAMAVETLPNFPKRA